MKRELREQVWARCNGYCEKCGKPMREDDFAVHHRRLRSQGGQDVVENLLALHHKCHNLGTHSVHMNPTSSMLRGYIVPRHAEPSETPLTRANGDVLLLTPEGTYELIRKADSNGW